MVEVLAEFSLGGKRCQVLCVHRSRMECISTAVLKSRGDDAQANMGGVDSNFFWTYRSEVPEGFLKEQDRFFMFPQDDKGGMRYVVHRVPGGWDQDRDDSPLGWFSGAVLVKFVE